MARSKDFLSFFFSIKDVIIPSGYFKKSTDNSNI